MRTDTAGAAWLERVLERNAQCAYLRSFGSPKTAASFRAQVPICCYDQLDADSLQRIWAGEADVLFRGSPVALERTGGSAGGPKLIPYSAEGLSDFRAALSPWLADVVQRHAIDGSIYFATSPATRPTSSVAGLAVGLPDGAYLGERWGAWVAAHSAVPLSLMSERDVEAWRAATLAHLREAQDLELVSVWSPTFFLRLLDELPDPVAMWPRLKVVSCWASSVSARFAAELAQRLPHAKVQPKGLLSTECVVTVPDASARPVLVDEGFFEFESGSAMRLADDLAEGCEYEVIATTASGLYRYRTGDVVRCGGWSADGRPILEFLGRSGLASDLVGEKFVEAFVHGALEAVRGFRFLAPAANGRGYVLITDADAGADAAAVDRALARNPQYEHAQRMGQLAPLRHVRVQDLYGRFAARQLKRGVRLGDVKPVALVTDASIVDYLEAA